MATAPENSDKCDKLTVMHFIGKDSDINNNKYKDLCDSKYLPLYNLPCVYFPFYYEKTENSVNNIKKLVPILETSYVNSDTSHSCLNKEALLQSKTIPLNVDDLLSKISNISQDYQPYNNKHTFYMTLMMFLFWVAIFFIILKIIFIKFVNIYSYIIIFLSVCLLIFAAIWALVFTSQNI
jgi:hypothetical protein